MVVGEKNKLNFLLHFEKHNSLQIQFDGNDGSNDGSNDDECCNFYYFHKVRK